MKICVLGAGVIGVSTAYALARLGHEVTVIDKANAVATGASHANGAQLSYGYVEPFASPKALAKLPAYMIGLDPAIRFGVSFNLDYWRWGLKFLENCRPDAVAQNFSKRVELALKSRDALAVFENELPPASLKRTGEGKLVLANSQASFKAMQSSAQTYETLGLNATCLSPAECVEVEPTLSHWRGTYFGGMYTQTDTALDPLVYCQSLAAAAQNIWGCRFFFDEEITGLDIRDGSVRGVQTDKGYHACDATIVCLGNGANRFLTPLGVSVPIYPMQGYSLTLSRQEATPRTSITDLQHKIVFANLGDKIRIAGFMDANQQPSKIRKRQHRLLATAQRLWPDIADFEGDIKFWQGQRPMMPSGVPRIGSTAIKGLHLNVGHGALGYTFAAGSAMMIAEQIGPAVTHTQPFVQGQTYAVS